MALALQWPSNWPRAAGMSWPSRAPSAGLEELDDRVKTLKLPGAGGLTLAPMDVTNDDAMRHLCLSIHQRWGKLDLWIHTAIHAAPLAPAGSLDVKDWDKSIATNVRATGTLIPMIEPLLRAGDGQAMFFDDPRAGEKFFGAYGATKAAQIALGAQLGRRECADRSAGPHRNARADAHRHPRALLPRRRPRPADASAR